MHCVFWQGCNIGCTDTTLVIRHAKRYATTIRGFSSAGRRCMTLARPESSGHGPSPPRTLNQLCPLGLEPRPGTPSTCRQCTRRRSQQCGRRTLGQPRAAPPAVKEAGFQVVLRKREVVLKSTPAVCMCAMQQYPEELQADAAPSLAIVPASRSTCAFPAF
jgi:hypothetical protein